MPRYYGLTLLFSISPGESPYIYMHPLKLNPQYGHGQQTLFAICNDIIKLSILPTGFPCMVSA